MSNAGGVAWSPTAAGGMTLQTVTGTTLFTVSSTGAVTFGAGVTVPALRIQNMTEVERDALTASAGTIIYNTTTNKLNVRVAAAWEAITSA